MDWGKHVRFSGVTTLMRRHPGAITDASVSKRASSHTSTSSTSESLKDSQGGLVNKVLDGLRSTLQGAFKIPEGVSNPSSAVEETSAWISNIIKTISDGNVNDCPIGSTVLDTLQDLSAAAMDDAPLPPLGPKDEATRQPKGISQYPSVTVGWAVTTSLANIKRQHRYEAIRLRKQAARQADEYALTSSRVAAAQAHSQSLPASLPSSSAASAAASASASPNTIRTSGHRLSPGTVSGNTKAASSGSIASLRPLASLTNVGQWVDGATFRALPRAILSDFHNSVFAQTTATLSLSPHLVLAGGLDSRANVSFHARLRSSPGDAPYTSGSFNNQMPHGVFFRGIDEPIPFQVKMRAVVRYL